MLQRPIWGQCFFGQGKAAHICNVFAMFLILVCIAFCVALWYIWGMKTNLFLFSEQAASNTGVISIMRTNGGTTYYSSYFWRRRFMLLAGRRHHFISMG
jgi:hypothetical protein